METLHVKIQRNGSCWTSALCITYLSFIRTELQEIPSHGITPHQFLLKNRNILSHSKFWLKATHVTAFCIHIFSSSQTKTIPPPPAMSCCFPCCGSSQHHWRSRGVLQTAPVLTNVLAKKRKKGFANGFAAPLSSKCLNVFAFLGQPFEKSPRETWESRTPCWS